jgi:hypothetical protein
VVSAGAGAAQRLLWLLRNFNATHTWVRRLLNKLNVEFTVGDRHIERSSVRSVLLSVSNGFEDVNFAGEGVRGAFLEDDIEFADIACGAVKMRNVCNRSAKA